ncbi:MULTISPECIES: DUF308 domain-containing protein [unclassified Streptomyces]|uniref:DUF308 domain-containing protein n=1 Tax=unclassified Streptomyces TaxID=2593676 RepID=UPI0037F20985
MIALRALTGAITTLALGGMTQVWPDVTLHVLGVSTGLCLLVTGGFRFVRAFGRRNADERFPGLLVAILFLLGGVLCLRHPFQTVAATAVLGVIAGIVVLMHLAKSAQALTRLMGL